MPSEVLWSDYFVLGKGTGRVEGKVEEGESPSHICIERAGHEAQVTPRGPPKPGSFGDSGDTEVGEAGIFGPGQSPARYIHAFWVQP